MALIAPNGRLTAKEARPLTLLSTNLLMESMLATVEEFSNVSKFARTLPRAVPMPIATSATTTSQVTHQTTCGHY